MRVKKVGYAGTSFIFIENTTVFLLPHLTPSFIFTTVLKCYINTQQLYQVVSFQYLINSKACPASVKQLYHSRQKGR